MKNWKKNWKKIENNFKQFFEKEVTSDYNNQILGEFMKKQFFFTFRPHHHHHQKILEIRLVYRSLLLQKCPFQANKCQMCTPANSVSLSLFVFFFAHFFPTFSFAGDQLWMKLIQFGVENGCKQCSAECKAKHPLEGHFAFESFILNIATQF